MLQQIKKIVEEFEHAPTIGAVNNLKQLEGGENYYRIRLMALAIHTEPIPLETNADGVVCVAGTRVTLDTIVAAFNEGATAEEIVQQYPSLYLADVYGVISYYLRERSTVDAYLQQWQLEANTLRQQNQVRFDSRGIRDRLLARQKNRAQHN